MHGSFNMWSLVWAYRVVNLYEYYEYRIFEVQRISRLSYYFTFDTPFLCLVFYTLERVWDFYKYIPD